MSSAAAAAAELDPTTDGPRPQLDSTAAAAGQTKCLPGCRSDGCAPGCARAAQLLLNPPGARCIPRGESYFIGCWFGFYPVRVPGSAVADTRKGDGEGYWRQLSRFVAWQVMVWLAWLLVLMAVTVALRATAYETVTGLRGYARVSPDSGGAGWCRFGGWVA